MQHKSLDQQVIAMFGASSGLVGQQRLASERGATMGDAAEILGISHQRVQQLLTPSPARDRPLGQGERLTAGSEPNIPPRGSDPAAVAHAARPEFSGVDHLPEN